MLSKLVYCVNNLVNHLIDIPVLDIFCQLLVLSEIFLSCTDEAPLVLLYLGPILLKIFKFGLY